MSRLASLLVAFGLLTAPLPALSQSSGEPVTIFAAASTTDAVNDIAQAYAAKTGGALRPVLASSSTLARQIAQGAPADIFLRSEEHTSELQSLMRISYAVFCLKKKKINNTQYTYHIIRHATTITDKTHLHYIFRQPT